MLAIAPLPKQLSWLENVRLRGRFDVLKNSSRHVPDPIQNLLTSRYVDDDPHLKARDETPVTWLATYSILLITSGAAPSSVRVNTAFDDCDTLPKIAKMISTRA